MAIRVHKDNLIILGKDPDPGNKDNSFVLYGDKVYYALESDPICGLHLGDMRLYSREDLTDDTCFKTIISIICEYQRDLRIEKILGE